MNRSPTAPGESGGPDSAFRLSRAASVPCPRRGVARHVGGFAPRQSGWPSADPGRVTRGDCPEIYTPPLPQRRTYPLSRGTDPSRVSVHSQRAATPSLSRTCSGWLPALPLTRAGSLTACASWPGSTLHASLRLPEWLLTALRQQLTQAGSMQPCVGMTDPGRVGTYRARADNAKRQRTGSRWASVLPLTRAGSLSPRASAPGLNQHASRRLFEVATIGFLAELTRAGSLQPCARTTDPGRVSESGGLACRRSGDAGARAKSAGFYGPLAWWIYDPGRVTRGRTNNSDLTREDQP